MKLNYFLLLFLCPLFIMSQPGSEGPITPINSTITYQGVGEGMAHIGTGEYKVYYDNVDGVLDKPIFFVDGFDPNDSRDIPSMYSLLDYGNPVQNLADIVRDEGFDIVVLNFPTYERVADGATINGGADFIQRNAFILVELINTINSSKVGSEENVVIGPSMGGLISRYALRYMEQNTINHDTRLYLSFDSPHLGANVPIGIQYLFNYMVNGDPEITEAEPLVNGLLNSPAAQQMLIDHYLGHLQSGSNVNQDPSITGIVGAPNFRDAFQNEIDAMGFPQDSRNVAISNGSGVGQMTGSPGMELINHTFDTGEQLGFETRATIDVHFKPEAGQSISVTDFLGEANILGSWTTLLTYSADATSPASSDGLDSAPGGMFDLHSFDDGSNALITDFVNNLNSQYFNFIPTLSSLAIVDSDWYNTPSMASSPFDASYIPDNNEPHVMLTEDNVAFAIDEILQDPSLSISTLDKAIIRLQSNVIENNLTILSKAQIDNANITIVDITGKVVFNKSTNISNRTRIDVNLHSGLYLFNIGSSTSGSVYKTKLIVK